MNTMKYGHVQASLCVFGMDFAFILCMILMAVSSQKYDQKKSQSNTQMTNPDTLSADHGLASYLF